MFFTRSSNVFIASSNAAAVETIEAVKTISIPAIKIPAIKIPKDLEILAPEKMIADVKKGIKVIKKEIVKDAKGMKKEVIKDVKGMKKVIKKVTKKTTKK